MVWLVSWLGLAVASLPYTNGPYLSLGPYVYNTESVLNRNWFGAEFALDRLIMIEFLTASQLIHIYLCIYTQQLIRDLTPTETCIHLLTPANSSLMDLSNKSRQKSSSSLPAGIPSGVRSSAFYTLPYWKPIQPPIDPMHTIHYDFMQGYSMKIIRKIVDVSPACTTSKKDGSM